MTFNCFVCSKEVNYNKDNLINVVYKENRNTIELCPKCAKKWNKVQNKINKTLREIRNEISGEKER